MRFILIFSLFILSCASLTAQSISLPVYQQGQYENDTIFSYYGALPTTGIGSINLGGTLASNFITGVNFKMVIDSVNQGSSPFHSAFADSSGTMVPIYQGDTLNIPASFQIFSGNIGFHITIEGTPLSALESYLCDLGYAFTLSNDWGMIIQENNQNTCLVDQSQGLHGSAEYQHNKVYPNPTTSQLTIETEQTLQQVNIIALTGKTIATYTNNLSSINAADLPSGIYFIQLVAEEDTITKKFVKQ